MGRPRRRRSPVWSQDPDILARLETVEAMYLDGYSNAAIAAAVGTSRVTVQRDLERLESVWLKHIEASQDRLRGRAVRRLEHVYQRALAGADADERHSRAVLYGLPFVENCPGGRRHGRQRCDAPHQVELRVQRDDKGSARFHGQAAQHLEVARKALIDQARLLGLDKVAFEGDGTSLPDALRRLLLEPDDSPGTPRIEPPALPERSPFQEFDVYDDERNGQ